ncbi:hypothetical protein PUNSTDRAFT_74396 [Punctularia strigosozonata HHB-11173 SS5]|uniref:uncharacterized protein n=1 Tax=Punctularia strigosozonata (strain HHB-11173) TaxID=741275 RepID=UPI0004416D1D|nr:uncharacterized protein PUNSTDRAFT_74396 [Punctularia strigosozonata HHB-11173 SS5]EIN05541.1 hypothetical protein PUNSTDRAFT_74396 [Punctularia strigosozonata HHB-11173 SS5]
MTVVRINGWDDHNFLRARWIKAPERRRPGQTSAHVAATLRTEKIANDAIRWGITIRGKSCNVRRLTKEATRCNRCQRFGCHFAAQCREIHNTCGTCGSISYATAKCEYKDKHEKHYCVNCRQAGHAAWSCDCPTLKEKNREVNE